MLKLFSTVKWEIIFCTKRKPERLFIGLMGLIVTIRIYNV